MSSFLLLIRILTSLLVDEILLPRDMNWCTNLRGYAAEIWLEQMYLQKDGG